MPCAWVGGAQATWPPNNARKARPRPARSRGFANGRSGTRLTHRRIVLRGMRLLTKRRFAWPAHAPAQHIAWHALAHAQVFCVAYRRIGLMVAGGRPTLHQAQRRPHTRWPPHELQPPQHLSPRRSLRNRHPDRPLLLLRPSRSHPRYPTTPTSPTSTSPPSYLPPTSYLLLPLVPPPNRCPTHIHCHARAPEGTRCRLEARGCRQQEAAVEAGARAPECVRGWV